eukprot:172100_1
MSSVHKFVFLLCSSWFACHRAALSQWTKSSTKLPIDITSPGSICGHSSTTNKLFILSGNNLMSYDLSSKQFTTHSTTLPVTINCGASCYAQFNQYLYFIVSINDIGVFDMNTQQIQFPLSSNQSLTARGPETCLAMSNDGKHLFIVGGRTRSEPGDSLGNPIKTFQIYDIDHGTLVTGPRMNGYVRYYMAPGCAVLGNRLYHFGGYEQYYGPKGKVEYIDVSNIENIAGQTWYSHGALNPYRSHQRTVVYQGLAYNIGGLALLPGGGELDTFETDIADHFDCGSGQNVVDTPLPFAMKQHCVATTDNAIFVMNGQDLYWATAGGGILTCNPTMDPTYPDPSADPTADPSTSPTTTDPSTDPTANPTTDPSTAPTADPSTDPTDYPSTDPTPDTMFNEAQVQQETTMTTLISEIVSFEEGAFDIIIVYQITAGLVAMILILIVCIACVWKQEKNVSKQQKDEAHLAQDDKMHVPSEPVQLELEAIHPNDQISATVGTTDGNTRKRPNLDSKGVTKRTRNGVQCRDAKTNTPKDVTISVGNVIQITLSSNVHQVMSGEEEIGNGQCRKDRIGDGGGVQKPINLQHIIYGASEGVMGEQKDQSDSEDLFRDMGTENAGADTTTGTGSSPGQRKRIHTLKG